jgi:hypothetical protein
MALWQVTGSANVSLEKVTSLDGADGQTLTFYDVWQNP